MKDLDNLFRQQLDACEIPPPPTAWSRVEASLARKNNPAVWFWRAAALVVSLTGIWWYAGTKRHEPTMALHTAEAPGTVTAPQPLTPRLPHSTQTKEPVPPRNETTPPPKRKVQSPAKLKPMPAEPTRTDAPATEPTGTPPVAAQPLQPHTPAMVITYELPSMPPAGLAATETIAGETGIYKVRALALQMKHSEGWLGKIRSAKNDLFALDLKKETAKEKNRY